MYKILVIEDDPNIRDEVLLWLTLEDYEAIGASDGQEGIDLAFQVRPDLIICDIMMPQKDGYRVLLEVRTQPATALIPFIFLTAKQEKTDIRYGMELGADDYLTKPFMRESLLHTMEARLARQKLFAEEHTRQANLLRQGFLRTFSHELRTPLVGILGVGELLAQDAERLTPAKIVEYAGLITTSGERLHRLIENHLLYLQLEHDSAAAVGTPVVNAGKVVQAATIIGEASEDIAATYARPADLRLALQPGLVCIGGQELHKIIVEIVDNAFKFSKPQSLVQIRAAVEDNYYMMTISDQGRGIAPENMARIDAYMQFERAKYEQQGTGLGLAIARRLVELAGGTFQIESTVDQGTTIRITLAT